MSTEIALLLGTTVAAVVLFSLDRIPTDVTALGVLLFLIITGLLPASEAFAGFGSDVFVMMLGLLVLMEALTRTGVTDWVGRLLRRRSGKEYGHLLLLVMVAAVAVGAFMSNTAATAFFLPIVIELGRRAKAGAAKLLMPLAFASILASSITLVSTSTNIVVSGLMAEYGLPALGMFELTPVGIAIAVVGVLYMLAIGRRLVPDRIPPERAEDLSVDLYLTELVIRPGSSLVGKTLQESRLGRDLGLTVMRIVRDDSAQVVPQATTSLDEGDVLLVEAERENVLRVKEEAGIDIRGDVEFADSGSKAGDIWLAEVILLPGSALIGRTLAGLRLRERHGLQVLAISRHGEKLRLKMSRIRLRTADVLVVQGDRARIVALARQGAFRFLSEVGEERRNRERAPIAVSVFVGVLMVSTLGLVALPVAMLLGALLVFVTRCITPEEAYSQISWKALIVIASMLSLGVAMQTTGTAEFLAAQIVAAMGSASPPLLLTGFFALTVLLTQPMSNQAAAAVVVPIALQTAGHLNLNPRSFAIMIALAASCSFLTPLEPSCLLVYGPGRYQFRDFAKVGLPLTVLIYAIAITMVPLFWPVGPLR